VIRSRFARLLGFGLSLLAATVSSLAGGAMLIRCEEPDGCVQIELVARTSASSTACGGHEHEAPPIAPDGDALSHPCKDTVIASFSEEARPGKGVQLSSKFRAAAPPSFAVLAFASAREVCAPSRVVPRWCTHRVLVVPSSVVLRI
jgi:hypothetical protein